MAWAELTEANLLTRISGTELDSFRASVLADGQVDPVASTMVNACNLARGYISAGGFDLGSGASIPEIVVLPCADLVIWELMTRSAGIVIDPNGARANARDEAMRILRDIANGKLMVEEPTTDDTEVIGVPLPTFTGRDAEFGRELEDGI